MKTIFSTIVGSIILILNANAQIQPISINKRINDSKEVILGKVINEHSYWNKAHTNIYTLHEIEIVAYLKGKSTAKKVALIDLGGIVDNQLQVTCPSVHLTKNSIHVLMLENDNIIDDDKEFRNAYPNIKQCLPAASIQGDLTYQNNTWIDAANENAKFTGSQLQKIILDVTNQASYTPEGLIYNLDDLAKEKVYKQTRLINTLENGVGIVTTVFQSGVKSDASKEMVIKGSGFGSTTGTILFPDADNGGSSNFTFPSTTVASYSRHGNSSDILSWIDTEIRIRIPRSAGTGTMTVQNTAGTSVGSTPITIEWAEIPIYSTFNGFSIETGQRAEQANRNTAGGYTFQFSSAGTTSFFADAAAKAAFERALVTWRCGTQVNWSLNKASSSADGFAADNTSIVMYDNSLASGVLGRCTSRFLSSASASCNLYNSLWYVREMDVQIITNASTTLSAIPATWNYAASGTSFAQFSFESVMLHELGHGLGMGHVIDPAKVMNYNISNGQDKTTLAPSDIAGGTYKVAHSTSPYCITSVSPMTALSPTEACLLTLPLSLELFYGKQLTNTNSLEWQYTNANEISKFRLLRSTDDLNYSTIIGEIPSSSEINYSMLDNWPVSGNNYYKLEMHRLDGQITYSDNVLIHYTPINRKISVTPNPTKNFLNINLHNETTYYDYSVLDVTGKIILEKRKNISKQIVDLSSLSNGIYYINIRTKPTNYTYKIIKE